MKKKPTHLTIPGLPPIPVSNREVGPDDVVVCMRASVMPSRYFDDDQEGVCFACGHTVLFRPYMAKGRKLCLTCLPSVAKR